MTFPGYGSFQIGRSRALPANLGESGGHWRATENLRTWTFFGFSSWWPFSFLVFKWMKLTTVYSYTYRYIYIFISRSKRFGSFRKPLIPKSDIWTSLLIFSWCLKIPKLCLHLFAVRPKAGALDWRSPDNTEMLRGLSSFCYMSPFF